MIEGRLHIPSTPQKFKLSWSRSDRPDEVFDVSSLVDLLFALRRRGVVDGWVDVYSNNNFAGKIAMTTDVFYVFYWSKELAETYFLEDAPDWKDFLYREVSPAFCDFFDPYMEYPSLLDLEKELGPDDDEFFIEIHSDSDPYLTYLGGV